jgi:hypothetical protein
MLVHHRDRKYCGPWQAWLPPRIGHFRDINVYCHHIQHFNLLGIVLVVFQYNVEMSLGKRQLPVHLDQQFGTRSTILQDRETLHQM